MSRGAKGTESISLLGIEASGEVVHTQSLFFISVGDYAKPNIWGVLRPLPDEGTPSYIKINPLHLSTSYSFLGVSRTDFDSSLSSISTKGEYLEDLAQDPASEEDDGSRWICSRGVCFLPSDLVGWIYDLGAHPTIVDVAPKLFALLL